MIGPNDRNDPIPRGRLESLAFAILSTFALGCLVVVGVWGLTVYPVVTFSTVMLVVAAVLTNAFYHMYRLTP